MKSLSDEELVKAYYQARELGLDPNFIQQLELAIKRRRIYIGKSEQQKNPDKRCSP